MFILKLYFASLADLLRLGADTCQALSRRIP